MNYLLDTCVISELVRPEPNLSVQEWLQTIPSDTIFLSVLTIGEIRKGLVKLPRSKKKEQLALWLTTLLEDYKTRIIPIDLAVSETWAIIQGKAEQKGNPMPTIDGLIAATALTHNLWLVTRNENDFKPSQVPIVNPWNNK